MARRIFFISVLAVPGAIVALAQLWPPVLWSLVVVGPLLARGLYDVTQTTHSLLRAYPLIGHGRYLFEAVRPEIQQYFVESDTNGRPYSREFRSLIYQRAKEQNDTVPFGTLRDVDSIGYEWLTHSLCPIKPPQDEPRVRFGGPDCAQPYMASHLNISAMSYGSMSGNAILALNAGARIGGFAHNTGEGGISPYHLEHGGDLIWQIGTAYFGCRTPDGGFDADAFEEHAKLDAVKMIEIKLSQGAKPAHGGILPAAKVTAEIAAIRGVPMGQDVLSPAAHPAFDTPVGLLHFVTRLRNLSGGKPVGFKLCIGHRSEFLGICKAMLETDILPDFITVDGAEGGTGAAPEELSNSVGMPMRDGVLFVHNALTGVGLRDSIRIIAAGRIASGFHMVRAIALGADTCNAARAMMFALGCIQARRCNTNECPVGVATQEPWRNQALVPAHKSVRVANYHRNTIEAFLELVSSNGLRTPDQITGRNVLRRVDATTIRPFSEVYEYLPQRCLLDPTTVPERWRDSWTRASAARFGTAPWSMAPAAPIQRT